MTKVRAALVRSFGKDVLPATDGAGAETPAAGAAAGALSVPVDTTLRSGKGGTAQRGWELAHWAVAQSEALGIDEVAYAGKTWESGSGWRTERKESGTTSIRIQLAR